MEITRFRLSCMRFYDQAVAEWFGLELARLDRATFVLTVPAAKTPMAHR